MQVSEYSEKTKVDNVTPPWAEFMKEEDFISYMPSYAGKSYLDNWDANKLIGGKSVPMIYYTYDPTKYGFPKGKKYPLIMFIHGATNSFDGKICVGHSGADMFASPEYQEKMGGAYLVVPLCNERKDADGKLTHSWGKSYLPRLKKIIDNIKAQNPDIGKVIIGGGSSGGYMTWEMLLKYPEAIDAAFPVSGFTKNMTDCLGQGKKIFVACARHDEFGAFKYISQSDMEAFERDPDVICYFPEFLRNGDKGIASLYFGIEMGQHCMITQVQANLMYDDGTPYLPELPEGVTGWIKEVCEE